VLVDHAVAALTHLCGDNRVNVLQELLALVLVVDRLHLLQVDDVAILIFADGESLAPGAQLSLTVFEYLLAEDLEALVEVLHGEYDGLASQSFHFGAPVAQPRHETVREAQLGQHVEVRQRVHILEQGRSELLVRMHIGLY